MLRALPVGRELRLIDCDRVGEPLDVRACEELRDDVALGVGDAVAEFDGSIGDCVGVSLPDCVGDGEGESVSVEGAVPEGDTDTLCVALVVKVGDAEGDGDCVGFCDKLVDALGVPDEDGLVELLVVCIELPEAVEVPEPDKV